MKVEYVRDGAIDTPLIRLHDFDAEGASAVHQLISDLSAGRRDEVQLHAEGGVESINGCRLILRVGDGDQGIIHGAGAFVCTLTRDTWDDVAARMEPFCEDAQPGTFQYLDETSSIRLLLSADGGW
jgi:hypothetical protein